MDDDEFSLDGVVPRLQKAFVTERVTPELFPFRKELVESAMDLMSAQERKLEAEKGKSNAATFRSHIYMMEVERVKFLLRSYLRCRLMKIQKHTFHILKTPNFRSRLSEQEKNFAVGYCNALETHFKDTCLGRLPERIQSLNESTPDIQMIPQPKLDTHVFIKINDEIGEYQPSQGADPILLERDDIMVVPYPSFVPLVSRAQADFV